MQRYKAAAGSIFSLRKTHDYIMTSVARQIRHEMKEICSLKHNSILRISHENLNHFSWEVIWQEFNNKVPTLVGLLQKLLPRSSNLSLSCIICLMLKQRCKHMSLLQRVVSVLLYGHGTSQQVYRAFLHIMLS